MLASGADLKSPIDPARRLTVAIAFGTLVSTLLMLKLIRLNPDLVRVMTVPEFWQKLGFSAVIAAIALPMVLRLSRPGLTVGRLPQGLAASIGGIWALAALALAGAEPEGRAALFFGNTWKVCPFLIAMLATPVFAGTLWAMRELAPTRLRLAGASAGLFAGGVGAMVYCFHCPELDAPFIAFWYLIGMLIPAAAGALLGPRLLRW